MLVFGSEYKQALGIYISSWESVIIGAGQMINICFKENSSPRKEKLIYQDSELPFDFQTVI